MYEPELTVRWLIALIWSGAKPVYRYASIHQAPHRSGAGVPAHKASTFRSTAIPIPQLASSTIRYLSMACASCDVLLLQREVSSS